jgi:hypothetical protein
VVEVEAAVVRRPRERFTPHLRCGSCGSAIHVSAGGNAQKRTWPHYCRTRSDNREACTGISARVEALDQLLLDRIESELLRGCPVDSGGAAGRAVAPPGDWRPLDAVL